MKKRTLAAIFAAFLLVAGCSKSEEETKGDVNQEQEQNETTQDTEQKEEEKTGEITQNTDLTEKVKDEEGVSDGQVYEQDGTVVGKIVLDPEVSDQDVKELTNKYINELKSEYKDKKVNVEVVRDGESIANITVENDKVAVEEKAPPADESAAPGEVPVVTNFKLDSTLPGFGMATVIVQLDTDNPEGYIVKIGDVELQYNEEFKDFAGEVPEESRREDVEVIKKQ